MLRDPQRPLTRYGTALLITLLAILIRFPLSAVLGNDVPFILFFPTVTLCAWYGGFGPGLLATFVSALAALFLYLEPGASSIISGPNEMTRLALFLSGSAFISWICGSLRAANQEARVLIELREQAIAAAEAARVEAEQKQKQLTMVMESMTDGFITVGADWRYRYLNARAEQLIGKTREEAIGRTVWEMFPDAKGTQFDVQAHRAIAEQATVGYEEFLPSVGKWFAVRVYPLKDGGHATYFQDITERKQAEDSLRASEELLATTLKSIGDAVITTDERGLVTFLNSVAQSLTGWQQDEAQGRPLPEIFKIVNEETRAEVESPVSKVLREGSVVGLANHTLLISRDGREIPIDDSGAPIRNEGGQLIGVVMVFRDITEQRRDATEKARLAVQVESYRAHLQAMVAGVPGIVWEAWGEPEAADQQIDFVSNYVEKMLGYSVEEWLSTPNFWLTIVHPDDKERAGQEAAAIFASGKGGVSRFRWMTKDGRAIWVESQSVVICDQEGRPLGMRGVTMDITEREEAEAARAKLAAIVESSDDVIIGKTLDGIITSWNQAAERTYGYSAAEAIGRHVSLIAPPELHPDIEAIMEKLRRGEHIEHYETRRLTRDGRQLDISLTISAIRDAAGRIVGASTIAHDITERKRREAADRFLTKASLTLSASLDYEATLGAVVRLAVPHFADWCSVETAGADGRLDCLAVAHVDPQKVEWARELQRRYPPDPSAPRGAYNVLRTGQSEFYPDVPDELLVQGALDDEHLKIMRQVGFRSAMIVPLKARDRILGVLSFVNAESGRRHTAEDLTLAEELARRAAMAVDNAQLYRAEQQTRRAAVLVSDRLLRLQTVSNALSQALTPREVATAVIMQGLSSLKAQAGTVVLLDESGTDLEIVSTLGFPPELVERWQRFPLTTPVAVADAVRHSSPVFIESFAQWKARYPDSEAATGSTGYQALVAFPLIAEGRTIGAMGLSFSEPQEFSADDRAFMLALTQQCAQSLERARLYETEQRLRAEAEDANRIKDEFLATVSHELRTPLTAIVGWSSMLRTNSFDQAATARGLETIERNAKAQTRIIEDLLDVSRIITGKLRLDARPVELTSIIRMALDAVAPVAASKDIDIETSLDVEVGLIWGDPARLQQVLWNLLSNAVKFTARGGKVEIRLSRLRSHAEISVTDSGEGISREFLPFVFERFRQADSTMTRAHGGLGLGLAIVRHLVELHGGTIRAESDGEGKGATFILELPFIAAQSASTEAHRQQQPFSARQLDGSPNLANVRILVVDDEADVRALLTAILEQCGASVRAVASAAEALDALAEFKPDLLVSDIGMPDDDGYSLIRKVRALGPEHGGEIPAVALTAYAGEEDRLRALLAGYQIHIAKPINPSELVVVVGGIVGTGESK